MNWIDIAIIITILISTLLGFLKGFIKSFLNTITFIMIILSSYYMFLEIESWLMAKTKSQIITYIIGYSGSLLIFGLIFAIINFTINSATINYQNNSLNKFAGLIFGFLRGVGISLICFMIFIYSLIVISDNEEIIIPKTLSSAYSFAFLNQSKEILQQLTRKPQQ